MSDEFGGHVDSDIHNARAAEDWGGASLELKPVVAVPRPGASPEFGGQGCCANPARHAAEAGADPHVGEIQKDPVRAGALPEFGGPRSGETQGFDAAEAGADLDPFETQGDPVRAGRRRSAIGADPMITETQARTVRPDQSARGDLLGRESHNVPVATGGAGQGDGVDQHSTVTQAGGVDVIAFLGELQVRRVACKKAQIRLDNQTRGLVRRFCGWRWDLPDKERLAINRRAERVVKAVEKGTGLEGEDAAVGASVAAFVLASMQARAPFDALIRECERDMVKAAATLPVAPWVDTVRGFGLKGLAIIVGEAGDLGAYANPAKLWKRMGLAVFDGRAQGRRTDPAEAALHGYNPRRRSAMWTLGDSLIKAQAGRVDAKTGEVITQSSGEYGAIYRMRKTEELARQGCTPMRAHRRAQRFMEKRLLRHLWCAWRDAGPAQG